jgi:hypothetical protein
MNLATKIKFLIIWLCLSLCGAGFLMAPKERAETGPPKANAMPVQNRETTRHVWIHV